MTLQLLVPHVCDIPTGGSKVINAGEYFETDEAHGKFCLDQGWAKAVEGKLDKDARVHRIVPPQRPPGGSGSGGGSKK